eukprot:784844-Rhodomonas_salina.1
MKWELSTASDLMEACYAELPHKPLTPRLANNDELLQQYHIQMAHLNYRDVVRVSRWHPDMP